MALSDSINTVKKCFKIVNIELALTHRDISSRFTQFQLRLILNLDVEKTREENEELSDALKTHLFIDSLCLFLERSPV